MLATTPVVSRDQVHAARLAGADAIVVCAASTTDEIRATTDAARRTHMLAVLEVSSASEIAVALEAGARALLVRSSESSDEIPAGIVVLQAVETADEARALRGRADAALLSSTVSLETDFESLVAELES